MPAGCHLRIHTLSTATRRPHPKGAAQPQQPYWKRLRYAKHQRANRADGITHALVFANSVKSAMWNLSALHDQTLHGLSPRQTAAVFCNHGSEALNWYTRYGHRPALVEWFLHCNGVLRAINSCRVPSERERVSSAYSFFTAPHRGPSNVTAPVLFHVLDNGQWQEWQDERHASLLRSLADTCFDAFGGRQGGRLPFYTEASYERGLRSTYRLTYRYQSLRELSTGAVAALTARLEYSARACAFSPLASTAAAPMSIRTALSSLPSATVTTTLRMSGKSSNEPASRSSCRRSKSCTSCDTRPISSVLRPYSRHIASCRCACRLDQYQDEIYVDSLPV